MNHERIAELVRMVEADPPFFGVLSVGERCAVALVLDNIELMRETYGSAVECAARIDPLELASCLRVLRDRR